MGKDFESWHHIKKLLELEDMNEVIYFKPKEIWMCSLGVNIGSEQDGSGRKFSRPVVVFRLCSQNTFLGIPITSQRYEGNSHYKFNLGGIDQFAKFSQLRTLSIKRFERKLATLPDSIYEELKQKLCAFIKNEIPLAGEISEAEANSY